MQQVFLSYTYDPHPDYVDETEQLRRRVSLVIESMDLRISTGEDLGGRALESEVMARIEKADALVALVTPWKDNQGNKVAPPWVADEFGRAQALHKNAIQILHPQIAASGAYAGKEYIEYSKDRLADVLLKLMKTLALWKKEGGRPMQIEVATDVDGQRLDPIKVRECEFQLMRDFVESDWRKATIWPQPGAVYAYLPGVPDEAKLRLRLRFDNEAWQSDYQNPVGRVQFEPEAAVKLAIAQDHQYAGSDFWNWRAWIEGKPAELDRIEKVKWFLHPSFSPSIVVSRDRGTGFRLERSGWGSFTLRAEVRCVDASEQTLRQPLKLYYPDEEAAAKLRAVAPAAPGGSAAEVERIASQAAERGVHKVYLSYAYSDRPGALAIRRAIESLGMAVVDGSAIGEDQPLEFAIQKLVTDADATVAYVSSDGPSPSVVREINASTRAGKPTLVVSGENLGPHSGVPPGVKVLRLNPSDASGIAAAVTKLAGAQPR